MRKVRLLAVSVQKVQCKSVSEQQEVFGRFVELESEGSGGKRKRLFYPVRVFWMFLNQVMSGNISCSETLQKLLGWLCLQTGQVASPRTGAYCKARQRLDSKWLESIDQRVCTGYKNWTNGRSRG